MACSKHAIRFLILTLCLFVFSENGNGTETETETVINTNNNADQTLSLIQFYGLTNTIPQDLIVLQSKIEKLNVADIVDKIPLITQQINQADWETMMAGSNMNVNFHQLSEIETRLAKIKTRIKRLNRDIESDINLLENELKMWGEKEKQLEEFKALLLNHAKNNQAPPTIDLEALGQVVVEAEDLLNTYILTTLDSGNQTGKLLTHVYKISSTVTTLTEEMSQSEKEQTTPSMFSGKFYEQFDIQLLNIAWDNIRLFSGYQSGYLKKFKDIVAIGLGFTLFLALLIYLTKPKQPSLRWSSFASKPIATAILFSGTAIVFYQSLAIETNLPPDWENLTFIPLVLTLAFYSDLLSTNSFQRKLVIRTTIMFSISQLFSAIKVPRSMLFMFVFLASLLVLIYYVQQLLHRRTQRPSVPIPLLIKLAALLPLSVVICGAAGYDQLAVNIFIKSLSVIVFSMLMILMFYAVTALLDLLLRNFPVPIVRSSTSVMVKNITPIILLLFSVVWFASILVFMWIHPSLIASLEAIGSTSVTIGTVRITPGLLIGVVIVGYATRLFSQGLTTILLRETLPRYNMDKGVQLSITRLIHYTILSIGFIIILHMFGFQLGQITLIGGALGVGIGFGLKEIVNNFVSGLILLFERPVKVGDVVVVGEEWGEIKELGLRATTVQTFDNAEIVIPNSALITQNVTNWTLASKQVRAKVVVGVAYGSDIEKVLEILLTCANENPSVLTQPEPRALFLSFGESSLDFELRVWISDINDRLMVLSELNQDIESEFSMNNVEIPFPQRDLHLKSIDGNCAAALKNRE